MFDLSSLESDIQNFKSQIIDLRRGGNQQNPKLHKILMLLAVLDLFDQNLLDQNKIYFDTELKNNFTKYFSRYSAPGDWCQPGPPFFRLKRDSFWHHKPKMGREEAYAQITTSGGGERRILENIEYAYLDDETFSLLFNVNARLQIRSFILSFLMK